MALPDAAGFRRETSPDAVARYLRTLIVAGTLRPGERVPRDEIAAALGVSPVPVREAIIALDREGWLRIEPHRGAFVHGVDDTWIADHYGLMGAVYALIAARACHNATDAETTELRDLGRRLAKEAAVDSFTEVNDRAMRLLIAAARSPRLAAAARAVPNVVPGNFFVEVPGALDAQRRAMTRTMRAVAARDADTAATTMRRLADAQATAVVDLLRARGVLQSD
jgi:DNA-binding GntR family transcriptional regulator